MLVFNKVKSPSTKEPITAIAKNNAVAKKVTEEIKVYIEEDHLKPVDDKIKEMYSELKSAILNLGKDIEVRSRKHYVAFHRKQNFVSFHFFRSKLNIHLNIGINQISDPLKRAKDYAKFSGKMIEITIKDRSEIPYLLPPIKQAYEKS